MAAIDPYQVLGIARTATQDEIKNAYRGLAKKHHPDLNAGKDEAKFKEISRAYELIGTPEARAKFDRGETEEAPRPEGFGGRPGGGPFYYETQNGDGGRYTYSFGEGMDEDLFESLFGGMRGGGRTRGPRGFAARGTDQLYRMDVDFRDSVLGAEREIALPNGKKLAVKIPSGISDGARLRIAGQGDPGISGGPAGDAYIEIHVRPSDRFKREGDDLVSDLPISIAEAVLGGEVRAPTIDGEVRVKVPPGSSSGRRLRLSGKGVMNRSTGKRGDQFVVLKIVLPETRDPELERLVREWSGRRPGEAEMGR